MAGMRHSGRVLRPPGPFPGGLLPDLWGFGASRDLKPAQPLGRHEPSPAHSRERPRRRDPLAGLIELIGKLFG
jgi:hypothetical protein